MSFTLLPPVIIENDVGISVIRAGDMPFAESLVIPMAGWSALDLLRHWYREIDELLAGRRDRCCLVSGLAAVNGSVVPSEWWTVYFVEGQIRLHYQILFTGTPADRPPDVEWTACDVWTACDEWWKHIPPYDPEVSEWIVTPEELTDWCHQCDVLFAVINTVRKG